MASGGVQLIGYAAAALSCVQLLPQVLQTVRTRVTTGVSPLMWSMVGGQTAAWIVFGSQRGLWPTVLVNVVLVFCVGAMLRVLRQTRAPGVPLALGVLVSLVVLEGLVWALLPIGVLGALAASVTALVFYPQTIVALRSSDLSGLSRPTWVLTVVVCLMWTAYGLGLHAPAIWASALHNGVLALVVLSRIGATDRQAEMEPELEPSLG